MIAKDGNEGRRTHDADNETPRVGYKIATGDKGGEEWPCCLKGREEGQHQGKRRCKGAEANKLADAQIDGERFDGRRKSEKVG